MRFTPRIWTEDRGEKLGPTMSAFWTGRRVALTGATGFVGLHAAIALRGQGADVVALVRPTSHRQRLSAAGIECRVAALDDLVGLTRSLAGCEVVVHMAGAVGYSGDWQSYFQGNVQATRDLLAAARAAGVRRVVHTSSIVAVGASTRPVSLDETAHWNLGRVQVPYVTTKRQAEEAALAANGGDLEVVVVNPSSVVGPDDYTGSEFGTLCQRFWKGRVPVHFGGGNNYVDVRDVASGLIQAAEHGRPGERYLLAGENRTYQGFFRELCQAARRTIPFVRLPAALAPLVGCLHDRLRHTTGKRPYLSAAQARLAGLFFFYDAGKARRELGFTARPLRESLADAQAFWLTPGGNPTLAA
jgi:dihydroflavonol-4-reductase